MTASTETILASIDMLISVVKQRACELPDTDLPTTLFYKEIGKRTYADEMIPHLELLRSIVSGEPSKQEDKE